MFQIFRYFDAMEHYSVATKTEELKFLQIASDEYSGLITGPGLTSKEKK